MGDDTSAWSTLHSAIRLARVREQCQRGRVDMFIHFVTIEMQNPAHAKNAVEYCKQLRISACRLKDTTIEIHALPAELIVGIETAGELATIKEEEASSSAMED